MHMATDIRCTSWHQQAAPGAGLPLGQQPVAPEAMSEALHTQYSAELTHSSADGNQGSAELIHSSRDQSCGSAGLMHSSGDPNQGSADQVLVSMDLTQLSVILTTVLAASGGLQQDRKHKNAVDAVRALMVQASRQHCQLFNEAMESSCRSASPLLPPHWCCMLFPHALALRAALQAVSHLLRGWLGC